MHHFRKISFHRKAAERAEKIAKKNLSDLCDSALSRFRRARCFIWAILILCVCACTATPTPPASPTPLRLGTLIPYRTPTPTATWLAPTRLPDPTSTPLPTPTPVTYTVKKEDTLLAIAFNYGISLEQLLAANPTVQPRMLSVGTVLVIPLEGALATPEPAEAPITLQAGDPVCYPQADGSLWCLMSVFNNQAQGFENLTGRISLFSAQGESLASQTVILALDLLLPGERLPMAANFPPFLQQVIVQGELLSSLPAAEGDPRYLEAAFEMDALVITTGGQSAQLKGRVVLPRDAPRASLLWVAAAAYDTEGTPVALRKWEIADPCPAEGGCSQVPFEGTLYSLGGTISQVDVLVEALP